MTQPETYKRIFDTGVVKIVEGPCEWWDPKKSFPRSKCLEGCGGTKGNCNNGYYSPRTVNPDNVSDNREQSDSFPVYLL
jgi:hypothetical protein